MINMNRVEKLKTMLAENPQDGFLQHALGLEYVKTGEDAKARTVFEQLLSAQPDYIGSYYHLAKLHERAGDEAAAVEVYQNGMAAAEKAGDRHAYNELKSAYEYLVF